MDCGTWTTDNGLWTVDHGLRTMTYGPWTVDYEPWTVDHGLQTMDYGPWTVDHGLRTMGYGLWTLDHGLTRRHTLCNTTYSPDAPGSDSSSEVASPFGCSVGTCPMNPGMFKTSPLNFKSIFLKMTANLSFLRESQS